MRKILNWMIAIIFLLAIMPSISAEISLWNTVNLHPDRSTVSYHAFYVFDDTSASQIGNNKDIPVTFYYLVNELPFNLTGYGGEVDWCNFTITHYHNIYGTTFIAWQGFFGGELLNTTIETQNLFFEDSSLNSSQITINLRNRDRLDADMECHYTNLSTLYVENVLVGRFGTYMPTFECAECTQYSYEELSNQIEIEEEITQSQLGIYNRIQTLISWNFQIWLIMSWIIKIVFIFIAVGLIFAGVYYFYVFLNHIAKEI